MGVQRGKEKKRDCSHLPRDHSQKPIIYTEKDTERDELQEQKEERDRIQQQFTSMLQNLSSGINTIHNLKNPEEVKKMEQQINQQQQQCMNNHFHSL